MKAVTDRRRVVTDRRRSRGGAEKKAVSDRQTTTSTTTTTTTTITSTTAIAVRQSYIFIATHDFKHSSKHDLAWNSRFRLELSARYLPILQMREPDVGGLAHQFSECFELDSLQ